MTRITEDIKLDFQDVLIVPKRSELDSRSKVDLVRTYKFKHSTYGYSGVPVVVANMDHTGTIEMATSLDQFQMSVALHKFYEKDALVEFFSNNSVNTFYSLGITPDDYRKFEAVMRELPEDRKLRAVCVDVANGYSRRFVVFVESLRAAYPNLIIMAGNVVTPDMTYDLLERGADIVKIGIGPGSVCTTRKLTGVGYPQLSAIMECADAAHGTGGHICGDGGITCAGDVVKAFAGGADFVMCGGLFAGHKECEGEVITRTSVDKDGFGIEIPALMRFYGMSSQEAMNKHYGGKANYRASEGKVVEVSYRGEVKHTVEEILGGLRSACTYVGARSLKQLPKCCTFVRTNRQLNNVFGG